MQAVVPNHFGSKDFKSVIIPKWTLAVLRKVSPLRIRNILKYSYLSCALIKMRPIHLLNVISNCVQLLTCLSAGVLIVERVSCGWLNTVTCTHQVTATNLHFEIRRRPG